MTVFKLHNFTLSLRRPRAIRLFKLKDGGNNRVDRVAVDVHQNCCQIDYDMYDININVSTITATTYAVSRGEDQISQKISGNYLD